MNRSRGVHVSRYFVFLSTPKTKKVTAIQSCTKLRRFFSQICAGAWICVIEIRQIRLSIHFLEKFPPLFQIGTKQGGETFHILNFKNRPPPNCLKPRFWAFQNILRLDFFENFPKFEKFPPLFQIGTKQGGNFSKGGDFSRNSIDMKAVRKRLT